MSNHQFCSWSENYQFSAEVGKTNIDVLCSACFSPCCAWHWLLYCISFPSSCSERDDWYSCISKHIPDDCKALKTLTSHSSVEVKGDQIFQCLKREGSKREREERRRVLQSRVPSSQILYFRLKKYAKLEQLNSSQLMGHLWNINHTPYSGLCSVLLEEDCFVLKDKQVVILD